MTPGSPVRLVATDLDGTLLRGDGLCSERTRAVLAAVERAGVQVMLVTARPPRWLHDLADVVGAHGLALCGNGAFVYDVRSRQVLAEHCLTAADVVEIAVDLRDALPGIVFAVESREGYRREWGFLDEYTTAQDNTCSPCTRVTSPDPRNSSVTRLSSPCMTLKSSSATWRIRPGLTVICDSISAA